MSRHLRKWNVWSRLVVVVGAALIPAAQSLGARAAATLGA